MSGAFTPDMRRWPNESLAGWLNRLREARGNHHVFWYETPSGELRLRSRIEPQSKLDL